MEKLLEDIAKNIKRYRKANNMTQKELAQKVGVSIAAVSNWETSTNSIDIDSLFKVCKALDVPISTMTEADPQMTLNDIEIELVERFRLSEDWQKLAVIKLLDMNTLPRRAKAYARLFQIMEESKKKE